MTLRPLLLSLARRIFPRLDRVIREGPRTIERLISDNQLLASRLREEDEYRNSEFHRLVEDYREAIWLAGGGWMKRQSAVVQQTRESLRESFAIRESDSTAIVQCKERLLELELALEDRSWKRMEAQARFEFSRWGIQQLILICRLYRIKNPIIQRGILISSAYVFGRHVEVSADDDDANEAISAFWNDPRNQTEIGHAALVERHNSKFTDGNIFWCFFVDPEDGQTILRHIDPLEIEEIITDPNDSARPQYYHRRWTEQTFDSSTGTLKPAPRDEWYVALGFEPPPGTKIKGKSLVTEHGLLVKIYHRRCGALQNWLFGCPEAYAALDWARARKELLEDYCSRVRALSRYGYDIETKGGAPAIAGIKQQTATTLANDLESIEQQPPPVTASTWVHGPWTTMKPIKTAGQSEGLDESRAIAHMAYMVFGLGEHFFSDIDSGNLATATTLDRPTELKFKGDQEVWVEDLGVILREVLRNSLETPNGKLREAWQRRGRKPGEMVIECERAKPQPGSLAIPGITVFEAKKPKTKDPNKIQIKVKFPAIVEGDIPQRIGAIVQAMTLGGMPATGIDERLGVELLLQELLGLGFDFDIEEVLEAMYPTSGANRYDANRTKEPPPTDGAPQLPPPKGKGPMTPQQQKETLTRFYAMLQVQEAALRARGAR